ncbi:MAG: phospholipid scramblase-related protein [Bacteriovoracaceae bacterium]|nr:phospholipid scramblase-related protein [Bacteriovoracaceae bacterium]
MKLTDYSQLFVSQKFEAAELFGFETRNKYQIFDDRKNPIAYAAEQRKGIFGFILRQYFGHWYKFDVHFFNESRELIFIAHHPFRWFFTRIELIDTQGIKIGAIQKRFSLLTKRFDVENAVGKVILEVASPIWKFWSFIFKHQGQDVASVKKKWSGILSEAFSDKDNFIVEFNHASMSDAERWLVLASAIFIDLLYFETKN